MAKRKRRPRKKPKKKPSYLQGPSFESLLSSFAQDTLSPEEEEKSLTPIEQRWTDFEAADYEEQIALCHQTIEEEELMDEENAFEMFNTIFYATVEHDERHHFEELANKLRERLPDIFATKAHYILNWQITNALAEGRVDDILPLACELAPTAGEHIDQFNRTLNMLDYHGQLPVLTEIMPIAWPAVKDSKDIMPWGIDEFATRGTNYIVFDCLERNPSLEVNDPELRKKINFYIEPIKQEWMVRFLDSLTGRVDRTWTLSDFGFERQSKGKKKAKRPTKTSKLSDEARENLFYLCIEFLRYLRHEEGVPFTKGSLARTQIYHYLIDRHAGDLEPQESMLEAMMRDPRARKRKPKMRYPDHWLCPDRSTLDRFLAQLLGFLSGRDYEAIVTFELVPAWLRFLESRQLIDAEQHAKTLQDLRGLSTDLLKVVKTHSDPALPRAIEQWGERE